jgi:hypothetical protein
MTIKRESSRRRGGFWLLIVGVAGLCTAVAAGAAVPMMGTPKTDLRVEQAPAPSALPTLTSGRGMRIERAFGVDDEDCTYEIRTQGTGLGMHEVKKLVCGD